MSLDESTTRCSGQSSARGASTPLPTPGRCSRRRPVRTGGTSPRWTQRSTTSSTRWCRRPSRSRLRRARGRGASRATATPPWWGPVGWPAPRSGAFLGGLGGYFTINPAAAHPLASASSPGPVAGAAVNQAHDAAFTVHRLGGRGDGVLDSPLSGPADPGHRAAGVAHGRAGALPGTSAARARWRICRAAGRRAPDQARVRASATAADRTAPRTQSDFGLGCILDSLTGAPCG